MKSKQKQKYIDLIILIGLICVSAPIILFFEVNFLTSTLLLFGVPSLYLLSRRKENIKELFAASLLFGVIFSFILDFVAEFNKAWSWPFADKLSFPYFVFGIVPIDVMIWFFLWVFIIILYYQHFVEDDRKHTISPKYPYYLMGSILGLIVMISLYYRAPSILTISYAYFWLGILTLLPFALVIIRKPFLLPRFLKATPFFVFLFFIFEITSLRLDHWRFPGEYLAQINVLGVTFPLEEFIIWIFVSSSVVMSYYELFVDDWN